MLIGVYAGTFDPITYGHIDLIKRAVNIVDELVVAVGHNPDKSTTFSIKERVEMAREALSELQLDPKKVTVESFEGLLVDYVVSKGAKVIIRGVRAFSDFEYEFQMALINRKFKNNIETIFMMPNESYSYVTSKIIREAAMLGADISNYVPKNVLDKLCEKYS